MKLQDIFDREARKVSEEEQWKQLEVIFPEQIFLDRIGTEGMYGTQTDNIPIGTRVMSWFRFFKSKSTRMIDVCNQLLQVNIHGLREDPSIVDINPVYVESVMQSLKDHLIASPDDIQFIQTREIPKPVYTGVDPMFGCFYVMSLTIFLILMESKVYTDLIPEDRRFAYKTEAQLLLTQYLHRNFAKDVIPSNEDGTFSEQDLKLVRAKLKEARTEIKKVKSQASKTECSFQEKKEMYQSIMDHAPILLVIRNYKLTDHIAHIREAAEPLKLFRSANHPYILSLFSIAEELYSNVLLLMNQLEHISLELHKL